MRRFNLKFLITSRTNYNHKKTPTRESESSIIIHSRIYNNVILLYHIYMNPVNPQQPDPVLQQRAMQQALQQAQPQQQTDQTTPDILQQAQDQAAQGAQKINAKTQQQKNDFENADTISKAMAVLSPNANMKDGEANTMSKIGQSIATPAYAGYCLQYVDDKTGNTNRQPTAIADYQVRAQSGQVKTTGTPPPGARVYFAPDASNGNMGHVGLANKDGTFTSATDNGVKTYSLADWQKYTGQKFIGWAK